MGGLSLLESYIEVLTIAAIVSHSSLSQFAPIFHAAMAASEALCISVTETEALIRHTSFEFQMLPECLDGRFDGLLTQPPKKKLEVEREGVAGMHFYLGWSSAIQF